MSASRKSVLFARNMLHADLHVHAAVVGRSTSTVAASVVVSLLAFAMGLRNAVIRKLAVPDMTTTVLTLTVTGLAADSSLAGGANPRWGRRVLAIAAMLAGALLGALLLPSGMGGVIAAAAVFETAAVVVLLRGQRPSSSAPHEDTIPSH